MGPHFSAGDFSFESDDVDDDEEDGRGDAVDRFDVADNPEVAGVVGLGGKDRERVVAPVGVSELYCPADWEASADTISSNASPARCTYRASSVLLNISIG
jgi:hypothetical protein